MILDNDNILFTIENQSDGLFEKYTSTRWSEVNE